MTEAKWMGKRLSIWPESQQALKHTVAQRVRKEELERNLTRLGD